ncbi:adenylate/guanylate cyclase domain-containing protein [Marimonas sp. MJW-29]|uniref:Adenylate/guanylate cyclase domain-containing protein n=1 Tax=Sulfitobacter sediminis TaxID=3234186 RepID=A0ABV3RUH5_9RHOB
MWWEGVSLERRLSAILVADMVGYSRLMEQDEADTLVRHKAHRLDLIDPSLATHHGRVVKTTGDGLLAEFPSVVEAVACAVEVQRAMARREADPPQDRRIAYRIGIHLGDVFHEGGDILGGGVNVAARLEALAEPGGICLSGTAFDQLSTTASEAFASMGEVQVKNIARPIRAYRWKRASGNVPLQDVPGTDLLPWFRLPRKPVLAVGGFRSSADEQFSTGLAAGLPEALVATLSQTEAISVVEDPSRSTAADYLIEGTVRGSSDRVRIMLGLADCRTNQRIQSFRFEYSNTDPFEIEDDISDRLHSQVHAAVTLGARALYIRSLANTDQDFTDLLQGTVELQSFNAKGFEKAVRTWHSLYERDPQRPEYVVLLAWLEWAKLTIPGVSTESRVTNLGKGREYARLAQKLLGNADNLSLRLVMACLEMMDGNHDAAVAHVDAGLDLDPMSSYVLEVGGYVKIYSGDADAGITLLRRAIEMQPFYAYFVVAHLAFAYAFKGDLDEAAFLVRQMGSVPTDRVEKLWVLPLGIAIAIWMGSEEEARELAKRLLRALPGFTIANFRDRSFFWRDVGFLDRICDALADAELPA